jgi:hypothetical protein
MALAGGRPRTDGSIHRPENPPRGPTGAPGGVDTVLSVCRGCKCSKDHRGREIREGYVRATGQHGVGGTLPLATHVKMCSTSTAHICTRFLTYKFYGMEGATFQETTRG